MASILDLMGHIQQQGEMGRERGLAQLVGKAYAAPQEQRQSILGTVASRGAPGMAMEAQQNFSKMDETAASDLAREAGMFVALAQSGDPQTIQTAYQQLAQKARASGHPVPMEYNPSFLPGLQQLAQAGRGSGVPAGFQTADMTLRAAGFEPGTDEYARGMRIEAGLEPGFGKSAPRSLSVDINGVPTQVTFDPTTGQYIQANLGGQPQPMAPQPQGGGDQFAFLSELGVPINSGLRTPEHNAEVGGVPNSYHLTGQARDIPPPRDPQLAAIIRQRAAANGLEVIDEGDHWHLEPKPGVAPQGGVPIVGRRAEDEAAAKAEAEERAKLGLLDDRGRIEAENAAMKARSEAGVQMDTAAGVEAEKTFGRDAAARFEQVVQRGNIARSENASLEAMRSLLQNTYTGTGAEAVLGAKRAGAALGFKVEGLGEAEAARAISNQLALKLRNPAGGEGMPGQMSNRDLSFLKESIPSLRNSPNGWRQMIQMKMALNNAAIQQAEYAEQLRQDGVPVAEIPGRLRQFAEENPIFITGQESAPANSGFRVLD